MSWVYFLGESKKPIIKIGFTADDLKKRILTINKKMSIRNEHYRLLGAVIGSRTNETVVQEYFDKFRFVMGIEEEYFHAKEELVEYINWLRQRWWTALDANIEEKKWQQESFDHWMPKPDRRVCPPPVDPDKLIQDYETISGPLANTVWSWMSTPSPLGDDFYTPIEIVNAAREAMGGIDLDAASHWRANYEHKIPEYFHVHRSAFENDWYGKVWLNPPYGNNKPWFDRMMQFIENGAIEQLCMISPVWVFNTQQALPIMKKVSASIILSPTPSFWGHPSETRNGTNHPHMLIYIGNRRESFIKAFCPRFGIPMTLAWDMLIND